MRQRHLGRQFQLARHACGRHHRGGDQQQHRRGRYRVQRAHRADPCAGRMRRRHVRYRRCDRVGLRRHRVRRAGQCQPGRSDQHVAGRQRQLLEQLPECDQQRGVARHHRGGGGRQQQCQRGQLHPGQLRQRDFGGVDHLGRGAFELLQLRHRHRHLRAGFGDPVDLEQRHHHAGFGQLRQLQRHLDGGPARGRRGGAGAVGRQPSADACGGGNAAEEHCTSAAGRLLGRLRRGHRQRGRRGQPDPVNLRRRPRCRHAAGIASGLSRRPCRWFETCTAPLYAGPCAFGQRQLPQRQPGPAAMAE
ncbi:hypothetical protein XACW160_190034 [Xanthomonas citri pv. citri]|nr:hypothetical protein XACW160_190034 [Xanthomonas citri pv. citri]CEE80958.1 hypothetical protein XAC3218_180191 [Xanthomonas citri pv. citri]CEH37032.1 hypothetical protein XACLE3_1880004 [Xanthomonas citri pv. citri]CEH37320.1 hypothetical protein XACJK48_2020007 [Xanthomonas citri pv. citri]CEL41259.1 hypothetical protein XACJK4_560018 [Xanthomonas citri pv. citri]